MDRPATREWRRSAVRTGRATGGILATAQAASGLADARSPPDGAASAIRLTAFTTGST